MSAFINIHTHKASSKGISIQNSSFAEVLAKNNLCSLGIHPWDIDKTAIEVQLEMLKSFCIDKKIVAVGEIGLDRAIQTNLEVQKQVFINQLDIAKQYQLPAIIHCVRAWSDILEIRKSGNYKNAWIFHGFTGNLQTALQIIQSGCYLSFGKALFTNKKLQDTFVQIPKEFIFFETDDSYTDIEEVYRKASQLENISIDDLKNVISQNFDKIFLS
jgi:TatD DNase family protein